VRAGSSKRNALAGEAATDIAIEECGARYPRILRLQRAHRGGATATETEKLILRATKSYRLASACEGDGTSQRVDLGHRGLGLQSVRQGRDLTRHICGMDCLSAVVCRADLGSEELEKLA
jgi:hypothetical protein